MLQCSKRREALQRGCRAGGAGGWAGPSAIAGGGSARAGRRRGALRACNGKARGRLRHATAGQGACLPGLNTLAYRPLNFVKYKTVRFFSARPQSQVNVLHQA